MLQVTIVFYWPDTEAPCAWQASKSWVIFLFHWPEAERIRRFLNFPVSGCSAVDSCIGDGGAFKVIAEESQVIRYGIELDAYRVEQAREVANHVIHGDALDVHCPVESLSLLYLNPPYDFECGPSQNRRLEQAFFEHCYRWLKPAGVLVLVVPGDRLAVYGRVLAFHFRDKNQGARSNR